MRSRVYFKFDDGTEIDADFPDDLDYLNIRQWRLLYLRYCQLNDSNREVCLIIRPKDVDLKPF